jgi:hypothetical protein
MPPGTRSPRSSEDIRSEPLCIGGYDSESMGPLFAVSDEGSAGESILDAAHSSAKAKALSSLDPMVVGVALDGERMTSAGEVPIGPEEYEDLFQAAGDHLFLTTNVGVRVNARLSQQLPEFAYNSGSERDPAWLEGVTGVFSPFLSTPDGRPRPLTIRFSIDPKVRIDSLSDLSNALEIARQKGKIGPPQIHRFSLLVVFSNLIANEDQIRLIERLMELGKAANFTEVAIDGELRPAARRRLGVQSLLNILEPAQLQGLLKVAREHGVTLTYRYQLDVESAARTIWTGLHTARSYGFSAGKYGLVPMSLEEQAAIIEKITKWSAGWTAIPAFYVDTPLITATNVYDPNQNQTREAAKVWLTMARGAGATIVLFDSPDRVSPRRLLKQTSNANEPGVLTIDEIEALLKHAKDLGISILWSGGITSQQAFELAKRKVFGIFSTSSTAAKIAVSAAFQDDPRLASENEPTHFGVRRIHAIIQAGFLITALANRDADLTASLEASAERLLKAEQDADPAVGRAALKSLNSELIRGWRLLVGIRIPMNDKSETNAKSAFNTPIPVPAEAVRVFRGRKVSSLSQSAFLEKLSTTFMPMTLQMQRLYGLTAYLPAVLPENKDSRLPDELALVFYRTQGAYHAAKRCVGGRAYSELHELVFEMGNSKSEFPALFAGRVEVGKAYHLFAKSLDWQKGSTRLCVAKRRNDVPENVFLDGVSRIATSVQSSPGSLDGVIFCSANDWLAWWELSSADPPKADFRFGEIAEDVFNKGARFLQVPINLLRPFAGIALTPQGDFLNFQFERVRLEQL